MNTKKIILLFVVFLETTQLKVVTKLMSTSKNSLIKNIEIKNNKKSYKEREVLLEQDANRILQVLEVFSLFEQYDAIFEVYDSSQKLFKNFFGLPLKEKMHDLFNKQIFIENIILSVSQFNEIASADLKYLCDIQIKYILSFKSLILEKMKKKAIYSMIVLSYYFYLFFPHEYIDFTSDNEDEASLNLAEKEINWQESMVQIPLEFGELGMLYNSYLYELYDSLFNVKLSSNKQYNDALLIKKLLPDAIAQDDFALERLMDTYKRNMVFFKNDFILYQSYQDKQEFFLMWLLEKKNIINALDKFFNEDSLFLLFTTVLLYKSILKINITDYYPLLNVDLIDKLKKIAIQAEFILYEFFSIFNKKLQIDWDALPTVIISENRLIQIIKYFSTVSMI